jgi:hypothetical protein
MTDYMLRTDTAADMDDALRDARLIVDTVDAVGYPLIVPVSGAYLDRIGPIPYGDTRYHANLRVTFDLTPEQVAALPTFDPVPSVPYRMWA